MFELMSGLLRSGSLRSVRARLLGTLMLVLCGPVMAAGVNVVDDRGVSVSLSAPPSRIVTLLPSLTETVCELGACSRLVGTDRYSNHPAAVRSLPKTGGLDDANVEMIVSLRPDVVLLAVSSRVIDRLEGLGLKVVALEPKTYEDVRRVAGKVSQVLGQGQAGERLWARLEAQVAEAARSVPASARGLSVYYEIDSAPYAAGESSFIGHTLSRLGAVNIVPVKLGPFPKLNPEYVVRADPQVIMVSAKGGLDLSSRPGWSRIRAIKSGHVCTFSGEQGDVMSRPGPRMGEAARIMADCLKGSVKP
jgi:iron complex transport system substrate-binding protein